VCNIVILTIYSSTALSQNHYETRCLRYSLKLTSPNKPELLGVKTVWRHFGPKRFRHHQTGAGTSAEVLQVGVKKYLMFKHQLFGKNNPCTTNLTI